MLGSTNYFIATQRTGRNGTRCNVCSAAVLKKANRTIKIPLTGGILNCDLKLYFIVSMFKTIFLSIKPPGRRAVPPKRKQQRRRRLSNTRNLPKKNLSIFQPLSVGHTSQLASHSTRLSSWLQKIVHIMKQAILFLPNIPNKTNTGETSPTFFSPGLW